MSRSDAVRAFVAASLLQHTRAAGEAFQERRDHEEAFLQSSLLPRKSLTTAPAPVREAFDFYRERVEAEDMGAVRVARVAVDGSDAYVVRTTTDGDDGWIELFDADGTPLGAARTYIELLSFGETASVRAFTSDFEFPDDLSDRMTRTVWTEYVPKK